MRYNTQTCENVKRKRKTRTKHVRIRVFRSQAGVTNREERSTQRGIKVHPTQPWRFLSTYLPRRDDGRGDVDGALSVQRALGVAQVPVTAITMVKWTVAMFMQEKHSPHFSICLLFRICRLNVATICFARSDAGGVFSTGRVGDLTHNGYKRRCW